jgi:redox-sensitive bicupin YhaK (pirin superfamily)
MENTTNNPIKNIRPLGFQWETVDPFLFCVHHEDHYPEGTPEMGPDPKYFKGRNMGSDFIMKDGFRMYHGKTVPGFPAHPHRGFETITVVRKGLVDHADSLGAAGRYGNGDVQWMTAGSGVQHAEMFPLLEEDKANPLELFQIWLNLPRKNKMVDPHFKMFWREELPIYTSNDGNTIVEIIAGSINGHHAPTPPPDSWAADPANSVALLNINMEPGSRWTLPKTASGVSRTLYFYKGDGLQLAGESIPTYHAVEVEPDIELAMQAGKNQSGILVLQGKPIDEPVIQYGPFVMNTKEEINQAFEDYNRTKFGGWPWKRHDQVHKRNKSRFAKHADGRVEEKQFGR